MSFFNIFKRKTNAKAVFLGLDSSGKSTFISFLQEGKFIQHMPTMGKKKLEMDVGGTRISLFDMGGQNAFRAMWSGEIKNAKTVVFVIDKAAKHRFKEAKAELDKILPNLNKDKKKLLIIANKHDLPDAATIIDIIDEFDLMGLENFEIIEVSAKTGYGMANAFAKFYSLLTGESINKTTFASAISVFNSTGTPIVTELDEAKYERQALQGGFMVAIGQFSEMKLPDDSGTRFITFESKENGTFIVAKSMNYIGSLLWTDDLKVTMDQSKQALKDLLEHLEDTCNPNETETVAFHVEHYVSNIM
ncbi:MAG: ADP-ribosylation factor-like protein [Promethearchaeota archaeon]